MTIPSTTNRAERQTCRSRSRSRSHRKRSPCARDRHTHSSHNHTTNTSGGGGAFEFDIANDSNLHNMIDSQNDLHSDGRDHDRDHALTSTNAMEIDTATTTAAATTTSTTTGVMSSSDMSECTTSEYILAKLYNYMKISEMSKYGIVVFEMTFSSYLPFLSESDLHKLATSYWCNGDHFECMIRHRGDCIKQRTRLQLTISDVLLDAAMQSGASVDKIEAMLLQRRRDHDQASSTSMATSEHDFYVRNLKHRFWSHEVLARAFSKNAWLTVKLANVAMHAFVCYIFQRVMRSKISSSASSTTTIMPTCYPSSSSSSSSSSYAQAYSNGGGGRSRHFMHLHKQRIDNFNMQLPYKTVDRDEHHSMRFSEKFLRSFFASYFYLDDIPKIYKRAYRFATAADVHRHGRHRHHHRGGGGGMPPLSEETLRRWCELVELLTSRGALVSDAQFEKVIPLQYAAQLGQNTYGIISMSHEQKNRYLMPNGYAMQNIAMPDDIWDVLISYL